MPIASGTGTMPAAIGRRHLVGCLRSDSTSRMSFSRYVAEDTMQNATKPAKVCSSFWGSSITPAAAGANPTVCSPIPLPEAVDETQH